VIHSRGTKTRMQASNNNAVLFYSRKAKHAGSALCGGSFVRGLIAESKPIQTVSSCTCASYTVVASVLSSSQRSRRYTCWKALQRQPG